MPNILITNIKQLLTFKGPKSPRIGKWAGNVGLIKDASVLIKDGKITGFGKYKEVKKNSDAKKVKIIEANGIVLPGFCDSHTHPAFTTSRIADFNLRLKGLSYKEIKSKGGGITASIKDVRSSSEAELTESVLKNAKRFLSCGTTSIEAKSGYGLSLSSEIKSLRAIKNAGKKTPLKFVPTLLAAHSVPSEFKSAESYADYVIDKIIPQVAKEKLAVFCDVFCEKGFFSPKLSEKVLRAGLKYGLKPKIHAEQLTHCGGTNVACKVGALSVDHADFVSGKDIGLMAKKGVIATLLPSSNHYLEIDKYPPVKDMIASGVPVALATDFNPGSSPCWNMQFVISLACIKMKMTVEQALVSATVNGAFAMGLGNKAGVIDKGANADLAVFDVLDYRELAYYFGSNLCKLTICDGKICFL
ncbi:MAG TPA: imidazolonepropionase [Elusimicrobiales bacterium]|nr:imidazolonepropionase [Elusimicrobiales bacterium]